MTLSCTVFFPKANSENGAVRQVPAECVDSERGSCPSSYESVSVSARRAPRVGGWLAYNGLSVPACLLTESSLYSVFTQRIPEPF